MSHESFDLGDSFVESRMDLPAVGEDEAEEKADGVPATGLAITPDTEGQVKWLPAGDLGDDWVGEDELDSAEV